MAELDLKSMNAKTVLMMPFLDLPYFDLLKDSLEKKGLRIISSWRFPVRGFWFGARIDVLHIHMVDMLFRGKPKAFLYFKYVLRTLLRVRGIRLVWTCHEWEPHEGDDRFRQSCNEISEWLLQTSDEVIVHSQGMFSRLRTKMPRGAVRKVHLVAPGSLQPFYRGLKPILPPELSDVQECCSFVVPGFMRPDKGVDLAVEAFRQSSFENVRLVVAGRCHDDKYFDLLVRIADQDKRITFIRRSLSHEEMISIHKRAAAVVLPFRNCPTTASVLAAMSIGSFLICPDTGHCSELLADGGGILYSSSDPVHGIRLAMETVLASQSLVKVGREIGVRTIAKQSWKDISAETLLIYQGVRNE